MLLVAAVAGYGGWRLAFSAAPGAASIIPSGVIATQPVSTADTARPAGHFNLTGSLITARQGATATLLLDGSVLIAGGFDGEKALSTAELYDPATHTSSATGSMSTGRYYHTATLLASGEVLVVGGQGGGNTAELYDPTGGSFRRTGSMTSARVLQTATLLHDGRVLVAGGAGLASAELYDPGTGTFSLTGSMEIPRAMSAAALLANGEVLVIGGTAPSGMPIGDILASAELYDPNSGRFNAVGEMNTGRYGATATLLADGRVLVAGGSADNSTEIYDPQSGSFSPAGSMTEVRRWATATRLRDGSVLVAGGVGGLNAEQDVTLASAELFEP
jgi:WD40 repeat protein